MYYYYIATCARVSVGVQKIIIDRYIWDRFHVKENNNNGSQHPHSPK